MRKKFLVWLYDDGLDMWALADGADTWPDAVHAWARAMGKGQAIITEHVPITIVDGRAHYAYNGVEVSCALSHENKE